MMMNSLVRRVTQTLVVPLLSGSMRVEWMTPDDSSWIACLAWINSSLSGAGPQHTSVIISSCSQSPSNCAASSRFYSVCQLLSPSGSMSAHRTEAETGTTAWMARRTVDAPAYPRLLSMIERARVQADTIVFTTAICAREEGEEWQLASGLPSTMERARVEADTIAFITVICACEEGQEFQLALGLFSNCQHREVDARTERRSVSQRPTHQDQIGHT